jgi:hypothetical protein
MHPGRSRRSGPHWGSQKRLSDLAISRHCSRKRRMPDIRPRYPEYRALILCIYWDHETEPSVETPLGDFFAMGHDNSPHLVNSPQLHDVANVAFVTKS